MKSTEKSKRRQINKLYQSKHLVGAELCPDCVKMNKMLHQTLYRNPDNSYSCKIHFSNRTVTTTEGEVLLLPKP